MGINTLLVILLVWAVAGILAAFAFGKAMRLIESSPHNEELLPTAADNVRYFRRNKRKTVAKRVTVAQRTNDNIKQAS
ncbi:MAG: hypothetical protein OEM48_08600 [Gammaproteobacteria bacterium]|nr:hypothetical protein [Gammaproteobacteria bacterium]MDH3406967.1 hypothetical protein [Gammaproteobacteria bacterium]MDH3562819.1 hypothetical protein [Gammaproteobacteria bacterium]MDH5487355.1 hypothetical protein [Gammaproteobacteria bacterium]